MTDIEAIRRTLGQVMDPELGRSIVDLGMVHDLAFEDGTARLPPHSLTILEIE